MCKNLALVSTTNLLSGIKLKNQNNLFLKYIDVETNEL